MKLTPLFLLFVLSLLDEGGGGRVDRGRMFRFRKDTHGAALHVLNCWRRRSHRINKRQRQIDIKGASSYRFYWQYVKIAGFSAIYTTNYPQFNIFNTNSRTPLKTRWCISRGLSQIKCIDWLIYLHLSTVVHLGCAINRMRFSCASRQ